MKESKKSKKSKPEITTQDYQVVTTQMYEEHKNNKNTASPDEFPLQLHQPSYDSQSSESSASQTSLNHSTNDNSNRQPNESSDTVNTNNSQQAGPVLRSTTIQIKSLLSEAEEYMKLAYNNAIDVLKKDPNNTQANSIKRRLEVTTNFSGYKRAFLTMSSDVPTRNSQHSSQRSSQDSDCALFYLPK